MDLIAARARFAHGADIFGIIVIRDIFDIAVALGGAGLAATAARRGGIIGIRCVVTLVFGGVVLGGVVFGVICSGVLTAVLGCVFARIICQRIAGCGICFGLFGGVCGVIRGLFHRGFGHAFHGRDRLKAIICR